LQILCNALPGRRPLTATAPEGGRASRAKDKKNRRPIAATQPRVPKCGLVVTYTAPAHSNRFAAASGDELAAMLADIAREQVHRCVHRRLLSP
jgi:hypothetical protein